MLSEIAQINPKLTAQLDDDEPVSFLGMADVSEAGETNRGGERPFSAVRKGYTPFLNGDLLVAKITPCFENGKIAQAKTDHMHAFGSTEFHVVRVDDSQADDRYVLHLLRSPSVRTSGAKRMTGSAGQKRVPKAFLETLDVPLPSLPEQRRIADILDRADDLRAKRRLALALADRLLESQFIAAFESSETYPTRRLGELLAGSLRNGISPAKSGSVVGEVLTLSAVTQGRFDPSAVKSSTFAQVHDPAKLVRRNEFLICRGNGNKALVGRGVVVTVDMNGVAFPDTVIGARFKTDELLPSYMAAAWSRPDVRRQIESGARTTNGTFKINQEMLVGIEVRVPPVSRQRSYVDFVGAVESQVERSSQHLAELDELFASFQHRAFSGQL